MPNDGVDQAKCVLFGDLREAYTLAVRNMLTPVVSSARYADTDEVLLVIFDRVGGLLVNVDAVRIGVV
jgi:HK97 family phage major capsid protein